MNSRHYISFSIVTFSDYWEVLMSSVHWIDD